MVAQLQSIPICNSLICNSLLFVIAFFNYVTVTLLRMLDFMEIRCLQQLLVFRSDLSQIKEIIGHTGSKSSQTGQILENFCYFVAIFWLF